MPTHGSLTKAGKVRAQTPRIDGAIKKKPSPRRLLKSFFFSVLR
jgi:small subunit ribosomal protein S30e